MIDIVLRHELGGEVLMMDFATERGKEWAKSHVPSNATWVGGSVVVPKVLVMRVLEDIVSHGLSIGEKNKGTVVTLEKDDTGNWNLAKDGQPIAKPLADMFNAIKAHKGNVPLPSAEPLPKTVGEFLQKAESKPVVVPWKFFWDWSYRVPREVFNKVVFSEHTKFDNNGVTIPDVLGTLVRSMGPTQ